MLLAKQNILSKQPLSLYLHRFIEECDELWRGLFDCDHAHVQGQALALAGNKRQPAQLVSPAGWHGVQTALVRVILLVQFW